MNEDAPRDVITELKESSSQLMDALELGMFKRVIVDSNGSINHCNGKPIQQVDRLIIQRENDKITIRAFILESNASKLEDWTVEELDYISKYEPGGLFLDPNDARLHYLAKKLSEAKYNQVAAAAELEKRNEKVRKLTEMILNLEGERKAKDE